MTAAATSAVRTGVILVIYKPVRHHTILRGAEKENDVISSKTRTLYSNSKSAAGNGKTSDDRSHRRIVSVQSPNLKGGRLEKRKKVELVRAYG
jgi:hypothetical protein